MQSITQISWYSPLLWRIKAKNLSFLSVVQHLCPDRLGCSSAVPKPGVHAWGTGLWSITWPRLCNWDKVSKTSPGLEGAAKALSQTTAELRCLLPLPQGPTEGFSFPSKRKNEDQEQLRAQHEWILCFISTFSHPRESVAPFFLLVREAFSGICWLLPHLPVF